MKKLLRLLLFPFYVLLTNKARLAFAYGKLRGMECSGVESGVFSTTLTLHPGRDPKRNYLTFSEFMGD